MSECLSRRQALLGLATASGVIAASGSALAAATGTATASPAAKAPAAKAAAAKAAAAKPHVDPKEATAVALAYFEDAAKVDAKQFPTFKPGQLCSNCLQNTGPAADAWQGCNLFPNKLVAAKGWCKVYVKKP